VLDAGDAEPKIPAVLSPGSERHVVAGIEHVVQALDMLIAESDIAAQIPAAEILDRGRRVILRGGAMAMSAANAPTTTCMPLRRQQRDLTLRIGFVLFVR